MSLTRSTRSGSPTISPISPLQHTQNQDTFHHNQNSFNTTSHTHYHLNYTYGDRYHRDRRLSFTPTLASVASEDSSTTKSPNSPISDGITQVEGRNVSHDYKRATRMPVTLNSFHRASASLDGIAVEDRSFHQDYEQRMPVALNSGASPRQASASQITHRGSMKTRSLLSIVMNLSTRIGRVSRKSLWSKNQLSIPEQLKLWTEFNIEEVDEYIPEGMDKKYKNYMRSGHLGQPNAIPVWNPSPILGVNVRRRIRLDVGDVGTFTRRGGFRVAFNILLSEKFNKLCDYDVPKNFSPFDPPLSSEQEESCYIKDDGIAVNLDDCGAIVWEQVNCSTGALVYGFNKERRETSESFTTRYDISPKKKDKRRGCIFLPHGARVYSLKSKAAEDLPAYLNERLTDSDWLEYLDRLWHREKAPPIILTSVWAARSFACATYTVHPPNTSAVAQIWISTKGDKMCWTQVPEGFETACAPLDDGYDGNDKLKSQVDDQCFAIEGYALKSRKEVTKMRASLVTI